MKMTTYKIMMRADFYHNETVEKELERYINDDGDYDTPSGLTLEEAEQIVKKLNQRDRDDPPMQDQNMATPWDYYCVEEK